MMAPMATRVRAPTIPWVLVALLVAACSSPAEVESSDNGNIVSSDGCDDGQSISGMPPPELVADLGVEDDPRVAGEGSIFFIAPAFGTWGESAERRGSETYLKVGIWINDTNEPEIAVISENGLDPGSVEFAPTSAGLPGFLPTGIYFTGPGCWDVVATLGSDTAAINVLVS